MQVRLLNIYMSSYSFNYLNKLTYLTYQQVVGSYKLLGLKVTKVLPAKNTLDFFPLRGSPPVDKHKGYSGELKGFFKGFIK